MSIKIQTVDVTDLPFERRPSKADQSIFIRSELDEDALAAGETDPFGYMDLRDVQENFSWLIDADEVVLKASKSNLGLVLSSQSCSNTFDTSPDGKSFTRGELVMLIDETYREVYRLEANSQSSPTPAIEERRGLQNRPESDGIFGIWGHDSRMTWVSRRSKSIAFMARSGWIQTCAIARHLLKSASDHTQHAENMRISVSPPRRKVRLTDERRVHCKSTNRVLRPTAARVRGLTLHAQR